MRSRTLHIVIACALFAAIAPVAGAATVEGTAPFEYEGGGVYLLNAKGAFYMGRLWDGDDFDAQQSAESTKYPGQRYHWGRASQRGGGSCFWIGPRANSGAAGQNEYLAASTASKPDKACDDDARQALTWRAPDAQSTNFGSDFNCPVGQQSAGGAMRTWLDAPAEFAYNVEWRVTRVNGRVTYTAGEPQQNPSGPIELPAGTLVKYRYTSGAQAVVYVPGRGWGFVPRSAVHEIYSEGRRWGRWGLENLASQEAYCGSAELNQPPAANFGPLWRLLLG